MSDLGAILTISVILAIVLVAIWRWILIFCVIVCRAIIFAAAYNESRPHLPEPASLSIIAAGTLALLRRPRRN